MCQPQAGAPSFLKLHFVQEIGMHVCMCVHMHVCMYTSQVMTNHLREMKPE